MPTVLAYTTQALGHLFPLTPLLLELRDRGHDPEAALRTLRDLQKRYPDVLYDVGPGPAHAAEITAMRAMYDAEAARAINRSDSAALWAGAAAGFAEDRASPLESMLERREHETLHSAVAQLPEREREIVRMRYFQGMPSKAIAGVMGLSEARISQLHARAMTHLRDVLGEEENTAEEVKLAA